jgi:hypothetical protein
MSNESAISNESTVKRIVFKPCQGYNLSNANYSRQQLKAIGRVDGLVASDEELRTLMVNRDINNDSRENISEIN